MSTVNGFFGHVKRHHTRSVCMFAGFAVSIQLAFAVLLSPLVPLMMISNTIFKWPSNPRRFSDVPVFFDDPVSYFTVVSPYVFVLSIALFVGAYYAHTALTKIATGFRYIQPGHNVRLHNITRYLATTAGIEMPSLGVMPTPSLNSFACGRNAKTSTIVVTQGLLNELNDDELRAVIAHEIIHIKNGDVQLMAMANASQALIKLVNWMNPVQMRSGKGAKWLLLVLPIMIPLIIILAVMGFVIKLSLVIASVSRYFISSSREFIADAEAVRLTHNPAALISALSKIEGRSDLPGLDPMTEAMMIDGRADGEFASHPPVQERIQILMQYGGSMVYGAAEFTDTRSFGQRRPASPHVQYVAQTAYHKKTGKPLLARIDAGSKTNIFGLPKAATPVILFGFGLFFFIQMSANHAMNKMPGQLTDEQIANYVKPVIDYSPAYLALDLDGDGLETRRLSQSKTYYKTKYGGTAYRTGWLSTNDGFLFLDKNKNGRMDGISELITVSSTRVMASNNKISALTKLDANRDGRIDVADYQFKQLMVWRDFGNDGVAEDNEVFSLDDINITSLNVQGGSMRDDRKHIEPPKRYITASGTWFLAKGSYVGKANNRDPRLTESSEGRLYMVAFEMDLSRFKKPDGTLVVEAPAQPENPVAKETPFVSSKIKPKFGEIGPTLRGPRP